MSVDKSRGWVSSFRRFGRRVAPIVGVIAVLFGGAVILCATLGGTLGGCAFAPQPFSADLGVAVGGQQDMAAARLTIETGGIPYPDAIAVQGFLAEHAIPIVAPADPGLLYSAVATAWNKDFEGFTPLATLQFGFGTTLDVETFQREPMNLCLVIDRSGSMSKSFDGQTSANRFEAVKVAIDRLLAQLTSDDRVSVVTFNAESRVRLEFHPGNEVATIKSVLDHVTPYGGTDIARGLRAGLIAVNRHRSSERTDRVFLFTDALLEWPADEKLDEFLSTMREYANDEIGTTVLGLGSEFGHEVAFELSQIRGGNYFFLSDYERIVSLFDEEFDYLVTPVAYDVDLRVSVPFSFDVADVYGIEHDAALPHELRLSVPTLFLSPRQRGGSIFVRLRAGALVDFDIANPVAGVEFSYTTPDGTDVAQPAITATLPAGLDLLGEQLYFESDAVRRGVLLLNTATTLHRACGDAWQPYEYFYGYYTRDLRQAQDRLTAFLPYFDAMAEGLEDAASPNSRSLSDERALIEQLIANIQNRLDASNGNQG